MFKLPWQKKDIPDSTEKKSGGLTVPPYYTRAGLFESAGCYDLSFHALMQYYKKCAPLADAVDTLAWDIAEIDPVIWDRKEEVFIHDHPVLELLESPNTNQSYEDFMIEWASTQLIANNSFIDSIGNVSRPPLSIELRSPIYSTLLPDSTGDLGKILIYTPYISNTYNSKIINGRSRFFSDRDKEMWPVLGYNTDKGGSRLYGIPRIQSLYYDIEQCIAAGQHNTALLRNGARPSGVMTSKNMDPLTNDQYVRAQNQIDKFYGGPNNAGRVMLAEWFEYKDMIVNNRDMDFKTLKETTKESIYLRYDIPLPMVSTGTMTFSNYETSQVAQYENGVLPMAKYLLKQLTLAIMYRYHSDEPKRYVITVDETKVGALGAVRTKNVETLEKLGVNTINELRVRVGYDEIPGMDDIYRPANEIPIMDGDDDESEENETEEETEKRLRNAVKPNGDRRR